MKVVLAGGGTGGHITPLLAVAEALQRANPNVKLSYIGDGSSLGQQMLKSSGLQQYRVKTGKWRRYHNRSLLVKLLDVRTTMVNITDLVRLKLGVLQCLRLLRKLRPDVVFVKGGYVGLPVGLAAGVLRIPLVIHESDSVPGLANRLLSRFATTIATGFPTRYYSKWRTKAVFTGVPVRAVGSSVDHAQARKSFGLNNSVATLLIVGGSQGAFALNQAIQNQHKQLLLHYQIIHITGPKLYPAMQSWLSNQPPSVQTRYKMYSFLSEGMGRALSAADIVIGRAGMSSVAEIAAAAKPFIAIPHPNLADQQQNAAALVKAHAAILIEQSELATRLLPAIGQIMNTPKLKTELVSNIGKFARSDSADAVADLIIKAHAPAR